MQALRTTGIGKDAGRVQVKGGRCTSADTELVEIRGQSLTCARYTAEEGRAVLALWARGFGSLGSTAHARSGEGGVSSSGARALRLSSEGRSSWCGSGNSVKSTESQLRDNGTGEQQPRFGDEDVFVCACACLCVCVCVCVHACVRA